MLAEDLLDAVRSQLGGADVVYAEPPALLSGGFFTENYAFRLAGAPRPWDGPLVVRLFPSEAPPDLAHREAAVQRVLVGPGIPGAASRLVRRRRAPRRAVDCFVMERLPGRPLVGGIRLRELLSSGVRLFRRLVEMTASSQAWLHRLDAAPLVARARRCAPRGIERWFESSSVRRSSTVSAPGSTWLVATPAAGGLPTGHLPRRPVGRQHPRRRRPAHRRARLHRRDGRRAGARGRLHGDELPSRADRRAGADPAARGASRAVDRATATSPRTSRRPVPI